MQSKNKKPMAVEEREWVNAVKQLPCSVCDVDGPCEAHEIIQGEWFTVVALCSSCHRDPRLGWHGEKAMWHVYKMDELKALNVTIKRMVKNCF